MLPKIGLEKKEREKENLLKKDFLFRIWLFL